MLGLLIVLLVVGLAFYLLPLDPGIKAIAYKVLMVVVAVVLLVWVLGYLGVWHPGQHVRGV